MRWMAVVILLAGLPAAGEAAAKAYPHRWVFVSRNLSRDSHVEEIEGIVTRAAEHGLNGMVLSAGVDTLSLRDDEYKRRLGQVRRICEERGVEIIPNLFSVGYGGAVLAHNPELAAGIPVRDAVYEAHGKVAEFVPDPEVRFRNGGFEEYEGNRAAEYRFHDDPGEVSFIDTEVFAEGAASLRFENFQNFPHGHARVMQEIALRPRRCYRISCRVRTEGLSPAGALRFTVLAEDGRSIGSSTPQVPAMTDWREMSMGLNSLDCERVRVYVGVWGGQGGRFWLDDLRIEEVGLANVLRRPGTPVTVKDAEMGGLYEEGRDYQRIEDPRRDWRFDHGSPDIRLTGNSRIPDGRRLHVSYYHGIAINRGQVTVCMSEPELYEIWRREAKRVQEHLAPRRWLLSMDEIRAGGGCRACRDRGMTMGEILGDCITRQCAIIRELNPEAEVCIWSDMLDPGHNAHGDYYLVDGNFDGSWRHVPEDLIVVCWWHRRRVESLAHFSGLGFRTLAGAYYDGDTLENPRDWLAALADTPGAVGIMYTTWQSKYDLLEGFGDLVSGGSDD